MSADSLNGKHLSKIYRRFSQPHKTLCYPSSPSKIFLGHIVLLATVLVQDLGQKLPVALRAHDLRYV